MTSSAEVKSCCAAVYSSEAVRWLFGDALHPGGTDLTARLARALDVGPGDLVLDVGSGLGTSAVAIARTTRCDVVGVDLSSANVEDATARAAEAGLDRHVRFLAGDAEKLPLADASVAGALSECSFCLFPDKRQAAAELARVLRPGARLALADITAEPAELPDALRTMTAWTACLAGARPLAGLVFLLEEADFVVERVERHDEALSDLVAGIASRLDLVSGFGPALPQHLRDGAARARDLVGVVRKALDAEVIGYAAVYASAP
jgi:ubiquinone/menaquinone biosynthesis C-methylase UbiE